MTLREKDASLVGTKPLSAYASIRLEDTMVRIAELVDGVILNYDLALTQQEAATTVLDWLQQQAQQRNLQFIAVAFYEHILLKDFYSRLWLQADIVPYEIKREDAEYQESLENLLMDIAHRFDQDDIVYPQLKEHLEVMVADLVTLEDYRKTSSEQDFLFLCALAEEFRGKRLVFLNATPRGGGVALMRHALIRLLRLLGVDAHWHILAPSKAAFDVTKAKFHNVLQAVVSPSIQLTPEDIAVYESWIQENAANLEEVFKQADVIVIDDPQPAGLIPFIRGVNPAVKVIYRSHIQIEAALASRGGTPQSVTWEFLWEKIRQADCFVSHPLKRFVPDKVPAQSVYYMPATTDPLDGLNKVLTETQISTYLDHFNAMLVGEGQTPLDPQRPYIIQVARFDPSKGLLDVVEAYRKLYVQLEEEQRPIPQLVITGNGSIDDPDGVPIYNGLMQTLQSELYSRYRDDIKVMRLPHRDQILNALLRRSAIVLQLSIKEGFEVKVTEALLKGKPVIASNVGGIPLQIAHGINGFVIESGDTAQVAQCLSDLLGDTDKYERMSRAAVEYANRDYLTVGNAICWLYLALTLLDGGQSEGHYQWVKALADNHTLIRAPRGITSNTFAA